MSKKTTLFKKRSTNFASFFIVDNCVHLLTIDFTKIYDKFNKLFTPFKLVFVDKFQLVQYENSC